MSVGVPESALPPRFTKALKLVIGALGVLVLASWLLIAVVGLGARDATHVPGVWIALANYVDGGIVYPDLYDGVHYGGTRYMPLFFLLHAGLAQLTGDYIASGHLLVIVCTFAVLAILVFAMRRMGCTTSMSLGLASLVLLTPTGMLTTTTVRGDILALALQLGAIQFAPREANDTKRSVAAAAFCTLAFFSKSSALWAVAAITIWLLLRRCWRPLMWFLATCLGLGACAVLVLQHISGGLFLTNILGLTFLGTDAQRSGTAALGTALGFLREFAPVTWAVMGLALLSFALAIRARLEVYHLAFVFAVLIMLVAISDPGTGHNQLIDIVALSAYLVADSWSRLRQRGQATDGLTAMVAIVIAWIGFSTFMLDMRPAVNEAISQGGQSQSGIEELRRLLPRMPHVLSEDPAVPVILGEVPTVLDPWMLLRLGHRHPSWLNDLEERVEAREFDAILLLYKLDDPEAMTFYERQHFGLGFINAVERSYVWENQVGGLQLYVPAEAAGTTEHNP